MIPKACKYYFYWKNSNVFSFATTKQKIKQRETKVSVDIYFYPIKSSGDGRTTKQDRLFELPCVFVEFMAL